MSNPLSPIGSVNAIIPVSKKESLPPNKFSYGFQPALIPAFSMQNKNGIKSSNLGLGLGFLPISKPNVFLKKPDLQPVGPYKF